VLPISMGRTHPAVAVVAAASKDNRHKGAVKTTQRLQLLANKRYEDPCYILCFATIFRSMPIARPIHSITALPMRSDQRGFKT